LSSTANLLATTTLAVLLQGCASTFPTSVGVTTLPRGDEVLLVEWEVGAPGAAPSYLLAGDGVDTVTVTASGRPGEWTLSWTAGEKHFALHLTSEGSGHLLRVQESVEQQVGDGPHTAYRVTGAPTGSGTFGFAYKNDQGKSGSDLLLQADGSFVLLSPLDPAFWDDKLGGVPARGHRLP
jgi:hypothetical protein